MTRNTRQGLAILSAIVTSGDFRSAQAIHARLRADGEDVGLTTVYRHLALLTDAGQLHSIQAPDGETLYRRCQNQERHYHVLCRHCGLGAEVALPEFDQWAESTAQGMGFTEITHTLEIFGRCASCDNEG